MGFARKLTMPEVLFGFEGRIGRRVFLVCNLLVGFVLLATFSVTKVLTSPKGLMLGAWPDVVAIPWCLSLWPGTALACKRLHDWGLSGRHVVWMIGLSVLTHTVHQDLVGALASLLSICLFLSFLLIPGTQGPNRFGSEAGTRVDASRPAAVMTS